MDILNRIRNGLAAVRDVSRSEQDIRASHASEQEQRRKLLDSTASPAEWKAEIDRLIDARADAVTTRTIIPIVEGMAPRLEGQPPYALRPGEMSVWALDPVSVDDLIGIFPDLFRAMFHALVDAHATADQSTIADRRRRVEAADARIDRIEREHEEFVNEAAALTPPVTFELLPGVQAKRDVERKARERRQAFNAGAEERRSSQERADAARTVHGRRE
jgi:hypothetical protein